MNVSNYTTLKLSKKLSKAELEGSLFWVWFEPQKEYLLVSDESRHLSEDQFPAYDILNDICVKYAKKFFGEENINDWHGERIRPSWMVHTTIVLWHLQDKDDAEEYIWEHCLFNPKNK